ncbi:DUF6233 domain-containing protein [Streptomyces sp. NPDC001606]
MVSARKVSRSSARWTTSSTSKSSIPDALRRQVPACPHCRPDTALGLLE